MTMYKRSSKFHKKQILLSLYFSPPHKSGGVYPPNFECRPSALHFREQIFVAFDQFLYALYIVIGME